MAAHANSTNYRIVYSFLGSPDGGSPTARLIDVGGTLYGTTSQGGSYKYGACGTSNFFGCGTVFSVTTGGTETVLHSFGGPSDGTQPDASLIDVNYTARRAKVACLFASSSAAPSVSVAGQSSASRQGALRRLCTTSAPDVTPTSPRPA